MKHAIVFLKSEERLFAAVESMADFKVVDGLLTFNDGHGREHGVPVGDVRRIQVGRESMDFQDFDPHASQIRTPRAKAHLEGEESPIRLN